MCEWPDLLTSEGRAFAKHIFAKADLVEGLGARRQDQPDLGDEGAGVVHPARWYSTPPTRSHAV